MKIILFIMCLDSINIWMQSSYNEICNLDSYVLLSYTVFFRKDAESLSRSLKLLVDARFGIQSAVYTGSIILNIMLCWDLVIMINRPFNSKQVREQNFIRTAVGIIIMTLIARCIFG